MKEAFLESIRMIYPDGLDVLTDGYQWRDIVRIYSMGWADALMATGQKEKLEEWLLEAKALTDENWMPDSSWRWW